MASAVVVFGKFGGGEATLSANFSSETVASGSVSTASPTGKNYCVVTPIDGNVYVAFSSDANVVANAAQNPRIPVMLGQSRTFNIKVGTKVSVVNLP